MISIIQKEISFNSSCREMAKANVSLAGKYITDIFTLSTSNSNSTFSLKNRCTNFIKASGLLARAPLLCIPFINRATQAALRFLSHKPSSTSFINSTEFYAEDEMKIRYSQDSRLKLVESHFKDNIEQKKEFDQSSLSALSKTGFSPEELINTFNSLSPELSIDFINSTEFYAEDEMKARYSQDSRLKFLENYLNSKAIVSKEKINQSDLNLSDDEIAAFTKIGFNNKDCSNAFLKILAQSPGIQSKCSLNLKKYINTYLRENNPNQI